MRVDTDPSNYPRITVVTPSFNQGAFLEMTILSVLGQFYPNLEYIVMDGGSQDDSVKIIERYEGQIAYWQSRKDLGQADAINQGFSRATGDILCWINSDDFYFPGTLLKVAKRLGSSMGRPALLYGNCLYFREVDAAARVLRAVPYDSDLLRETDYIYQPSSFWTKALWAANGPLDTNLHFGFDWDWYIRATKHCEFLAHDEIFSAYRRHAGHKSGSGGHARRDEILGVVRRHGSAAQIKAYEYAASKVDEYEGRNRLLGRLKSWHVPYAPEWAALLTPGLWSHPEEVSPATFARCMGMFLST